MDFSTRTDIRPSAKEAEQARGRLLAEPMPASAVWLVALLPLVLGPVAFIASQFLGLDRVASLLTVLATGCALVAFIALGLAVMLAQRVRLLEQAILAPSAERRHGGHTGVPREHRD